MYIIFDTETNGLPKNYRALVTDVDNWPRVIQLGWITVNEDMTFTENSFFIKPDGWTIPKEPFWIDKGYSTERCEKEGQPIKVVLQMLINDINRSKYMIAHNVDFDYKVLGAEMIRYQTKASVRTEKICTMKIGTDICQLPGQYGYKWPKLEELYRHLFNREFIGAHDALSDCRATKECFFEMRQKNYITV
jgi:DNA polymerase-3 subunit epsilon